MTFDLVLRGFKVLDEMEVLFENRTQAAVETFDDIIGSNIANPTLKFSDTVATTIVDIPIQLAEKITGKLSNRGRRFTIMLAVILVIISASFGGGLGLPIAAIVLFFWVRGKFNKKRKKK